jgi:hypothetical protein
VDGHNSELGTGLRLTEHYVCRQTYGIIIVMDTYICKDIFGRALLTTLNLWSIYNKSWKPVLALTSSIIIIED